MNITRQLSYAKSLTIMMSVLGVFERVNMNIKETLILGIILITALYISAKPPARFIDAHDFHAEYSNGWRGQSITEADVPSHENFQLWTLHYAPAEYIQFSLGIGMTNFEVDEYNEVFFEGNYGFSFSAGGYVNTPAFAKKVIRFTAGVDFLFLNSTDDYDYKYSGAVVDPHLGIIFQAGPFVDIEAGGKGHFILGEMSDPVNKTTGSFSNRDIIRAYGMVTLASSIGPYAKFIFDFSPEITTVWEDGPAEASIGFAVGFLIKRTKKIKNERNYFPNYKKLKKKQDEMLTELEENR